MSATALREQIHRAVDELPEPDLVELASILVARQSKLQGPDSSVDAWLDAFETRVNSIPSEERAAVPMDFSVHHRRYKRGDLGEDGARTTVEVPPAADPSASTARGSRLDALLAEIEAIPDEDLAGIPTDFAANFDHYMRGAPRVEP